MIIDREHSESPGIHVLNRRRQTKSVVASNLAKIIINYARMPPEDLRKERQIAREISELFDWRNIIKSYQRACNQAIIKAQQKEE